MLGRFGFGMKKHSETDLTDEQWRTICAVVRPAPTERGRPRKWPLRTLLDAVLYLTRAGCCWRLLPGDFPPWQTVYSYFARWCSLGLWDRLLVLLRALARVWIGRRLLPSAGIVDSQAVRCGRQKGVRGYDAAHRTWGRKRQMLTDTLGLPLALEVTAGSEQDRTAAWRLLPGWLREFPSLRKLWIDQGYKSQSLADAMKPVAIEFVGAPKGQKGFQVQPKRWVIESSWSWAFNWRRLRSDYEEKLLHSRAFLLTAFNGLLLRKLYR